MARAQWDLTGSRQYELGVDHGMLYKLNKTTNKWMGVPWSGLISVSESPDGADESELWADNIKYGGIRATEKFSGSLEAYMYPEEFEECDGLHKIAKGVTIGQQTRVPFCLCYRTKIGNDIDPESGYRLHMVYNATCSPSEKSYETVNDSPDAMTFSWNFDTTPVPVTGHKNTAILTIDSTDFDSDLTKLKALEDVIYGNDDADPELPLPDKIAELIGA